MLLITAYIAKKHNDSDLVDELILECSNTVYKESKRSIGSFQP